MTIVVSVLQALLCGAIATRAARAWGWRAGAVTAARWLAWFVVFFSALLGVFLALGLAATLTGVPLLRHDLALGTTAVLTFAVWRATVGPSAETARSASSRPAIRGPRLPNGGSRLLAIAVAGTFLAAAVILCCGFPRGYEPRSYHLPIAVQMFRTQDIQVWDREYMETLPANASLYYGDLLVFLPERLVSASDLAFLAMLLLATYLLGRTTGADRSASLVAACGMASIPLVAFSALETGADVGGLAFLGAAAYFALAGDVRRRSDIVLAGLAGGLAFGFKSVHLVAIAFLAAVILWRRWKADAAAGERSRDAVFAAGLFLALVLALASPWLVRNQREFHNPLYPVYVGGVSKALGWPGAPDVDYLQRRAFQFEWVRSPAEWPLYPWIEWHEHGENFKHSSGLGPFFAGIVVPALLVGGLPDDPREAAVTPAPSSGFSLGRPSSSGAGGCSATISPDTPWGALVFAVPVAAWIISSEPAAARAACSSECPRSRSSSCSASCFRARPSSSGRVSCGTASGRATPTTDIPPRWTQLPPGTTIANLVAASREFRLVRSAAFQSRRQCSARVPRDRDLDPTGMTVRPPCRSVRYAAASRSAVPYVTSRRRPRSSSTQTCASSKWDEPDGHRRRRPSASARGGSGNRGAARRRPPRGFPGGLESVTLSTQKMSKSSPRKRITVCLLSFHPLLVTELRRILSDEEFRLLFRKADPDRRAGVLGALHSARLRLRHRGPAAR